MKPTEACFVTSVERPEGYPDPTGPEVVFAGRSNVGKSSLLNAVVGRRKLAFVSRSPGRTRLVNFFQATSLGTLVDLPGYGYAKVPKKMQASWKQLVNAYLQSERPVALFLLLVDGRHEPAASDVEMMKWLRGSDQPARVVLTKADAVKNSRRGGTLRRAAEVLGLDPAEEAPIPVSARTGEGINKVRALIHQAVNS